MVNGPGHGDLYNCPVGAGAARNLDVPPADGAVAGL